MSEQLQIDELRRELAEQKVKLDEFKVEVIATYQGLMGAMDDTMATVKKTVDAMDKVTKKYPVDPLWGVN